MGEWRSRCQVDVLRLTMMSRDVTYDVVNWCDVNRRRDLTSRKVTWREMTSQFQVLVSCDAVASRT